MAAIVDSAVTPGGSPGCFFKTPGQRTGGGAPKDFQRETPEEDVSDDEPFIRCKNCLQNITRPTDRITRDGAHRHTFANPSGIVYEIGCFLTVTGCGYAGSATSEFSWFAGYRWRIVFCGMCLTHLGWSFESSGQDRFHGLILNHLVEPE